jgi:hypothetical protein
VDLVAGIAIGWQAKFIFNPFAKVARAENFSRHLELLLEDWKKLYLDRKR